MSMYFIFAEGADDILTENITAQNDTDGRIGRIKLKWQDPPSPNGLIVTYEIQYSRVGVTNVSHVSLRSSKQQLPGLHLLKTKLEGPSFVNDVPRYIYLCEPYQSNLISR